MIEITLNDRLVRSCVVPPSPVPHTHLQGKKIRVKCKCVCVAALGARSLTTLSSEDDTVGDLKKLAAAHLGGRRGN